MRRTPRSFATLLALTTLQWGCAPKGAEEAERPTYSISIKVAKDFQEVAAHSDKKEWDAALAKLDKMEERSNLNPYEQASILGARAQVYFAQDQLNNLDKIIPNLEKSVALDAMPEVEQATAEFYLGQAYLAKERFVDASNTMTKFASHAKDIKPDQHFLIAYAHNGAKRFPEALVHAQKAVDTMEKPEEDWLRLLLSVQFELKHEAEVADILKRLIELKNKREDYLQLSATYEAMGKGPDARAALEGAHAKGLLTEEVELVGLARMYLREGDAAKAAALLDAQMQAGKVNTTPDNLELVARAKVGAGDVDGAQAALAKMGNVAASGDVYADVGRLEIGRGQWEKAREALSSAVQSGGLSAPGQVRLWLGIAHYNAKSKSSAVVAFNEAKKHPEAIACADQWLAVVKSGKTADTALCAASAPAAAAKK